MATALLPSCWGALAVDRMALHQFEDGPVLGANYEFLPGETAYFSCRIAGFKTLIKDPDREDERTAKLAWDLRVADPAGVLIDKLAQGRIESQLVREDKNWVPKFLVSFVIPPFAPSGAYRITAHIRDEVAAQEITSTLELDGSDRRSVRPARHRQHQHRGQAGLQHPIHARLLRRAEVDELCRPLHRRSHRRRVRGRSLFQSQVLPMLREIGARVSIDDFGTGYSSLAALADHHRRRGKIDRSFITDIHKRPRSQRHLEGHSRRSANRSA